MLLDIINNVSYLHLALSTVLGAILYYTLKNRGLPPGPIGLPFLGYWPFLDPDTCHLQLQKLGEKYGPLFSFMSTGRLYINLGSVKTIREALITKSDHFTQRQDDYSFMNIHYGDGLLAMKGEPAKTVRKFMIQQFRERGMTTLKDTMSGPIYDTVKEVVENLKKIKGEPVDIASLLLSKCTSVLRLTLLGGDGMSEEELIKLYDGYRRALNAFTGTDMFLSGNVAKYFVFPFAKRYGISIDGMKEVNDLLYKALERRKATFDETNVRDIFDAYIKERNTRKDRNDPTYKYFTDKTLVISLNQIVGDSTHFLALFISAFIKTLLDHPEEQEKIYKELVEVVGVDRNPTIEDKSKLTYTNAFISEVLRCMDLMPLFPSLECTEETTLAGYRIPKGAVLLYNIMMAHMNPEDYDEPQKFYPSRYISKNGLKPESPVIFGIGKRSCIGEGFAMIQTFLYLTTIIKNFKLKRPENETSSGSGVFYLDNKVNICASPRN